MEEGEAMMGEGILFLVEILMLIIQRTFTERALNSRRRKWWVQTIAWSAFFFVFNYLTYFKVHSIGGNMTVFLLSFFLLLRFLYEDANKAIIFVTAFMHLSGTCAEYLVVYGYDFLMCGQMSGTYPYMESYVAFILSKLVLICILKIVLLIIPQNKGAVAEVRDWLETLFVPAGSLLIILILSFRKSLKEDAMLFAVMIVLLTINIFTYYLYEGVKQSAEKKAQQKILQEQCAYYMRQCQESQALFETLNTFRHDMKQKYAYELALLEKEDYGALKEYCKETIGFVVNQKMAAASGNIYFDSVINSKAEMAGRERIAFRVELKIPRDMQSDGGEMGVLLGNLLDNALEAAKETALEERYIALTVEARGSSLLIKIQNPYKFPRLKKRGQYMTTKDNKKEHGVGLKTVEQIVRKHQGVMEIQDSNRIFEVSLLLCGIFPDFG